mgnify:CR=1 FL=1
MKQTKNLPLTLNIVTALLLACLLYTSDAADD